MSMIETTIVAETSAIGLLLNDALAMKDSEFAQPFAERLQLLLDAGNAFVPGSPVNRTDSATGANELVIPLEPSDSLLCLFTAFRAGDGNFEIFDHELSLAEITNTTPTKEGCEQL